MRVSGSWLRLTVTMLAITPLGACQSSLNRSSETSASTSSVSAALPSLSVVSPPRSGQWAQYRVHETGRTVDVYVAHDSQPKPVVILVQGSGCAPLMTIDPSGTLHDTSLFQDLIAPRLSRLHFAMVEKRGVRPLQFAANMTRQAQLSAFERAARECSGEYLQNVTKRARVDDLLATVRALTAQAWARQIILVGHSEGTHVTTGVLREVKASEIGAAGLFASAGPIPFYGGYVARGAGNRERFQSVFDRIRTLQAADDDSMYEGLPVRRWKTFWLDSTPIEDVRDSTVPLFVAQGSRDDTTLPADLFTLEAIRQQPNRSLRYVVVDDADHAFETPAGRSRLAELFDDFLQWALDPNRRTGLAVLN